MPQEPQRKFPAAVRWGAMVFLCVWFVAYWRTWGPANFLNLCDIAIILSCIGVWRSSELLVSSQAVSLLLVGLVWGLDVVLKLCTGHHILGGMEYLFDTRYPLGVRLLSFFHVILPVFLLVALRQTGYDRRALGLQSFIAAAAMTAARFTNPAQNLNSAFRDPFFHRGWGSAPAHVALMLVVLIFVVYWPTHWALARLFPSPLRTQP